MHLFLCQQLSRHTHTSHTMRCDEVLLCYWILKDCTIGEASQGPESSASEILGWNICTFGPVEFSRAHFNISKQSQTSSDAFCSFLQRRPTSARDLRHCSLRTPCRDRPCEPWSPAWRASCVFGSAFGHGYGGMRSWTGEAVHRSSAVACCANVHAVGCPVAVWGNQNTAHHPLNAHTDGRNTLIMKATWQ